jgi:predicted Holliday junction resolvase-like endonuclease
MEYIIIGCLVGILTILVIVAWRQNRRLQRKLTDTLANLDYIEHTVEAFKNVTSDQAESAKALALESIVLHGEKLQLKDLVCNLREDIKTLQDKAVLEATKAASAIKNARVDAVKRAQAVAHGFEGENFAPLLQNRWNHKDFRHMGDPIDFLVLAGMDNVRHSKAGTALDEVVLLDIKTGKSQLSTIQRRIRDAVVQGRVRFAVYNTDTGRLRCWPADPEPSQLLLPLKENK